MKEMKEMMLRYGGWEKTGARQGVRQAGTIHCGFSLPRMFLVSFSHAQHWICVEVGLGSQWARFVNQPPEKMAALVDVRGHTFGGTGGGGLDRVRICTLIFLLSALLDILTTRTLWQRHAAGHTNSLRRSSAASAAAAVMSLFLMCYVYAATGSVYVLCLRDFSCSIRRASLRDRVRSVPSFSTDISGSTQEHVFSSKWAVDQDTDSRIITIVDSTLSKPSC